MTENINKKVEALTFWQQPILCEPVKGGITNLNFRVEHGNEMFFVRLGEDIPEHGVYRFNELAASRATFACGISPEVFMQNAEQWFCVLLKVKLWSRKICGIFLTWKKSFFY